MSNVSEAGAAFSVKNATGTVVYTGAVGASLGGWNSAYAFVQPVDLDAVTTAGTYTISVGADSSPPFKIDTGQNIYGDASGERPFLLPVGARRAELHRECAANGAGTRERHECDDVPDAECELIGTLFR
jgi:Cellulase N-terminal ig-like domain